MKENEEQIKLKQELLQYIRSKKSRLMKEIDALKQEENEITDEVNNLQGAIKL